MGLKKLNSVTSSNFAILIAILFSLSSMLVSSGYATSRYENVQLQREYDDYFDEFIDLSQKYSNLHKSNSIKDLRPVAEFSQSNVLIKEIKSKLDRFLISSEEQKDTLLVDIGFELVQLNDNLKKLNKTF